MREGPKWLLAQVLVPHPCGCPSWLHASLARRRNALPFGPPDTRLRARKVTLVSFSKGWKTPRGVPVPGVNQWGLPKVLHPYFWIEFRFDSHRTPDPPLAMFRFMHSHTAGEALACGPLSGHLISSATLHRCKRPSAFVSAPGRLVPSAAPNLCGLRCPALVRSHWRLHSASAAPWPTCPQPYTAVLFVVGCSTAFETSCPSSKVGSILAPSAAA